MAAGYPFHYMFPFQQYDSEEELEIEMEDMMRIAERYAGPAQAVASCSTGDGAAAEQEGEPTTLS